ncbi:hypothetical protein ABH926_003481 [Catenulispora sp. GP43]
MIPSSPTSSPTESSPAVSPERAAALGRLLRLLESARPTDISAVASALPEAELAAAVEVLHGRLSVPFREYILTEGPSCALAALVRQVLLYGDAEGANTVDRILMRFDPEADAAFFEDEPATFPATRARRAILRERKGPDRRTVIPRRVKRMLLDAVAAGSGGRLDKDLLHLLAAADDPDLVLALMPYADQLDAAEAASVITTLADHGLKKEAKKHRALWAGRGGDFTFLGFRRFDGLPFRYALRETFDASPDGSTKPVSVDMYREIVDSCQYPVSNGLERIRETALYALRAGTMSATEVLEHTRPAGLTALLAVSEVSEATRPGERRAADDIRALIEHYATERLADDPRRWAQAVSKVNQYSGTLVDLLADPGAAHDRWTPGHVGAHLYTRLDAANILLATAPPEVAEKALLTRNMKRTITELTEEAPLCRALVEYVLARGTVPQRENLAANEATPDSILHRLLERTEQTTIPFAIMQRDEVGQDVLDIACAKAPRGRVLRRWIADRAFRNPTAALRALRGGATDPAWVLGVLRHTITCSTRPWYSTISATASPIAVSPSAATRRSSGRIATSTGCPADNGSPAEVPAGMPARALAGVPAGVPTIRSPSPSASAVVRSAEVTASGSRLR